MNKKLELNTIRCNKKIICSLSLILLLSMTLITVFTQTSLAQVGISQPEKTTGYIDVSPRLVGVGQTATVNLFIYPIPTNYAYQPYYDGYRGVTVTFTKPDGTKDTFMPVDATCVYDAGQTESLGAIFFYYEPDMAGNWSVTFTMPDQNLTDVSGTVLMKGCNSNTAYFTVQTEPVLAGLLNGYPWAELPNSNTFWNYPINSNNREWSQISGDWLGSLNNGARVSNPTCHLWQPYGSGPNTGHIVWKEPMRMGGIVGGAYGSISYGAINSRIYDVIIDGKAFQNVEYANMFKCIDLATGEVLYTADGTIDYGLHTFMNAFIQSGYSSTGNVVLESSYGSTPTAYLIGGVASGNTWKYYDPMTGILLRSIVNATTGFFFIDGSELAYGVVNNNLIKWNMTSVVNNNWPTGIEWQLPLPESLVDQVEQVGDTRASWTAQAVFCISSDASTVVVKSAGQLWGYSATDGTSLWNLTLDYPITANEEVFLYPQNYFIVLDPTESTFKCYSMLTGQLLWTSTNFSDNTWATTWTIYLSNTNDNENFYTQFPDGTVRAYSLTDGHEIWRSTAISSTEYPNNVVPYVQSMVMVDGKIYAYAGYSPSYKINPIPRFECIVCINATNGDTLFTLNGGIRVTAAANGYVIGTGDNDGNLYCLGKGQTSTTVTIQNNVITNHATTLITGNILDQSPAQAGTPAVADASISEWMDYLHMQNSTLLNNPPNPEGVPVTLTAVDPNGNTITIGTTTTDSEGNFAANFVPESTGMYTIKASFDGTNAYYESHSEAHLSVIAGSEATPVSSSIANPPYELYTIGMGVAVIIALAVVAVLLLKKKA
ncbi:MAG: PQQ-binding-like beta-propeller repeat protein [Candidatus Bathyarchaeia archaeon]